MKLHLICKAMRYQEAKAQLLQCIRDAKAAHGDDLGAIALYMDAALDGLCREITRTSTSAAKARQQCNWLDLYNCELKKKGGRK